MRFSIFVRYGYQNEKSKLYLSPERTEMKFTRWKCSTSDTELSPVFTAHWVFDSAHSENGEDDRVLSVEEFWHTWINISALYAKREVILKQARVVFSIQLTTSDQLFISCWRSADPYSRFSVDLLPFRGGENFWARLVYLNVPVRRMRKFRLFRDGWHRQESTDAYFMGFLKKEIVTECLENNVKNYKKYKYSFKYSF